MDTSLRTAHLAEEVDFKAIKKRFLAVNRERLLRTQDALRWRQRDFLDLLPLLFHINHPILPGYVSKETPAGIPDYSPAKPALRAAKALSKSFTYQKRAYRVFDIHAIYLMGSSGTIAYSEASDLDIWVCHDPALTEARLELLQEKVRGIERWAQTLELDAHIFLVDAEKFRRAEHGELTRESSGSMLHQLLLDEFYRTGLLLAGRYPLWWLVPPEHEADYEDYTAQLKRKRFIHAREHIDFGGPAGISAEEFYGATLWLLYKGIDSPYKSVLKILLMEVYASEHPHIDLLSMRFKRAIYSGETELAVLDPYLMMMRKVEEYLAGRNERERLELARRCLYFKVQEHLSAPDNPRQSNWRRELMTSTVNAWRWPHSKLLLLDSHNTWRMRRVAEERKELIAEFTRSYRFLSQFARGRAGDMRLINQTDLNVLGRKLYAAFERKAGKIDIIIRGLTSDLSETHLTLHQLNDERGSEIWMVFSGVVPPEQVTLTSPLKRAYSALELIAWCYFNKLINASTVIALYSTDSDLSLREVRAFVDSMQRMFPDQIFARAAMDDLSRPACVAAVSTFINVGLDPFSAHTRRGHHLTSNRTDALKYGGLFENLALTIDQLVVNSWQEVLTFRYVGVKGLMDCLVDYIRWSPPSTGRRPPPIGAVSFSSHRGAAIARRVEELFEDIMACFYSETGSRETRYVVGVEREFYVLRIHNDALSYQRVPSHSSLLLYLSEPQAEFSPVLFDAQSLDDNILPLLFARNRSGVVQCFYAIDQRQVQVYVLDERGSLFHQLLEFHDTTTLLTQLERFFESVQNRMNLFAQGAGDDLTPVPVEYYRIDKQPNGARSLHSHVLNQYLRSEDFLDLQVIGDVIDGELRYTLYCDGREFSALEYGNDLFHAVARYVLSRRASGLHYPIYITDVDLPRAVLGEDGKHLQSIHFLNYKKWIEEQLNQALRTWSHLLGK